MNPGIHYGMPMAEYLALPALSAGVIKTLLDRCPAAAWYDSPFNPNRPRNDDTGASDAGTIAHSILLEGSRDVCCVIDPADHPAEKTGSIPEGWTNKSIRAARDTARAAGKVPVLKSAMAEIDAIASAARTYLDSVRDTEPAIHAAFEPGGGHSEVTVVWREGETLCKMRADRMSADHGLIVDAKFTAQSVEPGRYGRTQMVNLGQYITAAWYRRGVRAATGTDPDYVFLAGELDAPHLFSLVGCDPSWLELGDEKIGAGLREWQECARRNHWPAYPTRVAYPELPVYERARWDERNGVGEDGVPATNAEIWKAQREAA